jgi:hypothetical protein
VKRGHVLLTSDMKRSHRKLRESPPSRSFPDAA